KQVEEVGQGKIVNQQDHNYGHNSEQAQIQEDMWKVAKGKSATKGTQEVVHLDVNVGNGFTPLTMSSTLEDPPRSMKSGQERGINC
ncbi:hypothetical protein HAX54_004205, partial [Datura stramonium]|nr:hypothetical protein [Datura stramonium]